MKNTARGSQYELEAKHYLEQNGWAVFRVHKRATFIRDKRTGESRMILVGADVFGCDLIAKKPGRTRYIQVSVDGRLSEKAKQVMAFPFNYDDFVEIWLRIPGKKAFRAYYLSPTLVFLEGDTIELNLPEKSSTAEEEPCENQGC